MRDRKDGPYAEQEMDYCDGLGEFGTIGGSFLRSLTLNFPLHYIPKSPWVSYNVNGYYDK